MASKWKAIKRTVRRRREFSEEQLEGGNLKRCLSGWELTALGLGSTLGVGVYVLVGSVALRVAGPSIVLSFLIAAAASMFAGLCYAEFGARVPRAGSSYIYTYVTIGELLAFIIGWNNILESMFGTASVARGLSMYVDSMVDHSMSRWFAEAAPISTDYLSPYFDIFAFLIVLVLGVMLAFGVRESSMVNNVFAIINTIVILFIVIAGAFKANSANWSIPESSVPAGFGSGGFFPYGVLGMLRGAAICFYGFVGFDTISASSEEVKEPRRMIPLAIVTVLAIVFVAYASVATVVTMMVPYYLQDTSASVATAFSFVGWDWARWIVTIGAIFGICASLFGALFPLPRLLYAMASDGLFFHWFKRISVTRKSPIIATIVPAVIIALLAGLLVLEQLVMLMCIGTLLSYTIVAICVIVLRYRTIDPPEPIGRLKSSYFIVMMALLLFICACIASALVWKLAENIIVPLSLINALIVVLMIIMAFQRTVDADLQFKTPLVPLIPCLSIYFNVHLMIFINIQTWIRVLIWIAIGLPIYIICVCCYKRDKTSNLEENLKTFSHSTKNGKHPIQIVVESPTPPDTMVRPSNTGGDSTNDKTLPRSKTAGTEYTDTIEIMPFEIEEIDIQQASVIENNEEREAKIIDLLDQVLQAEEDSFGEIISLKESKDMEDNVSIKHDIVIRKSLSQLSDAGSDTTLGDDVLSKYDVIAQVHREDLPKVTEQIYENGEANILEGNNGKGVYESVTFFNEDSDTNSQTDESGYSDTIDKTALNDSTEDVKDVPYIPPPPPLDENFFANLNLPVFVNSPTNTNFKKSFTVPKRPSKVKVAEPEEVKPRESVQSNNSGHSDTNLVFGSDRQINFQSKLNNIFQSRAPAANDENEKREEQRKRSNSTGNVPENVQVPIERPSIFLDLNKEIRSRQASQILRPVNKETVSSPEIRAPEDDDDDDDGALSKDALKSKLESIFSTGPFAKPRLVKSNPPAPVESYQTDVSSTESIPKPNVEKNDTLGRQKAKYNAVVNSIRLSLTKDIGDKV